MANKFNFVRRGNAYDEIRVNVYFHLLWVSDDHLNGGVKGWYSSCI